MQKSDWSWTTYTEGFDAGKKEELKRIVKMLKGYLKLTQMPDDEGAVEENIEWDRGFQAAIALITNKSND